jgi:preprotein translocase subunit SecF
MEEQTQTQTRTSFPEKFGKFHDKYYKLLLLIPAIILLFGVIYMALFYSANGDFIHRDISLTGGTTVTLTESLSSQDILQDLSGEIENLNVRDIYDVVTQEQIAVIVETTSGAEETREVLENYLGYELNEENSSFEFTGSSLSESFFRQLLIAVLIAFIFMALVVFLIFRTFVPSSAIILSAFADIFMTLILFNILGMKMSTAGIVAFLMLIGYSVDTDILLTNRVLKRREGTINDRIYSSFKTGMTMTLTSLIAVAVALVLVGPLSDVLGKILTVIVIGLGFDILNTWVTNASIIKWYAIKKEKKNE